MNDESSAHSLEVEYHGDRSPAELARLGLTTSSVLDFAVNVNPLGCAPEVRAAVIASAFERYPERSSETLRCRLAEHCAVEPRQVLVGNGATELLWSVFRDLGQAGQRLMCLEPTFSEARRPALAFGLRVSAHWTSAATDFAWDWGAVAEQLAAERPEWVYLCLPNNPSGFAAPRDQVLELIRGFPGTRFILDESFLALSTAHADARLAHPSNALRLRSLTKDLAIPGLRLGYLLGDEECLARLERRQPPWSVNGLAQAAGLAGLERWAHVEHCREVLLGCRRRLSVALSAAGYPVTPSCTVFQLVRVGVASEVAARCLRRGVLVRDCTSFGLPEYIRLAARPDTDHARLLAALSESTGECPSG